MIRQQPLRRRIRKGVILSGFWHFPLTWTATPIGGIALVFIRLTFACRGRSYIANLQAARGNCMKALVVYDSFFGNTEQIQRAIGDTLAAQATSSPCESAA